MATLTYAHIALSPEGVPYIAGTRTKVEEVILDHLAYRWDAEEIQRQHPALTLGQIHSALGYYYDHQEELDRAIDNGLREVAQIRTSLGTSPIRLKLRAKTRFHATLLQLYRLSQVASRKSQDDASCDL